MARRESGIGYALLAPSLFGIAAFLLLPILVVIWLSMQHWDLLNPAVFVGWDNFRDVFSDPSFGRSLLVTVLFVLLVIPLQTVLGLFAATLLSRGLPGSAFFRVIYVIPWICAPLALGVVWKWIFAPTGGALNAVLGNDIPWLSDPALALPAVAAVSIWSQVGYVTLFFMAGLAAIPQEMVDAAKVDGANALQIFWQVKLPLLRPTMFFVLVTGVISSFQAFDSIYALTPNGGPQGSTDVIATRIYAKAFQDFDLGQASVMALVLFAILVVITLAQQLYFRRRITYDLS
ncbi:multiple sugar transport system permease protein [Psychromicrobium silvestre]|uniref:Multiple sugar transport system permease protein n=1 Tax=Psychromicrobium silvestre TaxID=1645614 RepID=A0A7Y9LTA5_9MICC|nr:sugar ABC transporter permease [Psychromicrobium silvestre]NYE95215.1 multiple sugar transport system permease protein [Psychromicrobium silvestre]